jgi:hypothetical protein
VKSLCSWARVSIFNVPIGIPAPEADQTIWNVVDKYGTSSTMPRGNHKEGFSKYFRVSMNKVIKASSMICISRV